MKKAGIVILVIVLILVIGVELFLFLQVKSLMGEGGLAAIGRLFSGGEASGEAAAGAAPHTESPAMTQAPPPTLAPAADTPAPTLAPATATPEPTLAPTLGPPPTMVPVTATPEPTLVPSSSGSCSSNTGTVMDMHVDWQTADLGNGTTRVSIIGKVSSYSLDIGGTSAVISLGGQSTTCLVDSIKITKDEQTVTDLFSTTLDMPTGTTQTLTVDWFFNGSYSGIPMPHILAEAEVAG